MKNIFLFIFVISIVFLQFCDDTKNATNWGNSGTQNKTFNNTVKNTDRQNLNTQNNRENSGISQQFAGTWKNYTKYSETTAVLYSNGNFAIRKSSSYGGNNGEWGAASDNNSSGTWRINGNKRSGTLILTYTSGGQDYINYQVHSENGRIYWSEYYFDGDLYQKQ